MKSLSEYASDDLSPIGDEHDLMKYFVSASSQDIASKIQKNILELEKQGEKQKRAYKAKTDVAGAQTRDIIDKMVADTGDDYKSGYLKKRIEDARKKQMQAIAEERDKYTSTSVSDYQSAISDPWAEYVGAYQDNIGG